LQDRGFEFAVERAVFAKVRTRRANQLFVKEVKVGTARYILCRNARR
jgi:hypothetical protein